MSTTASPTAPAERTDIARLLEVLAALKGGDFTARCGPMTGELGPGGGGRECSSFTVPRRVTRLTANAARTGVWSLAVSVSTTTMRSLSERRRELASGTLLGASCGPRSMSGSTPPWTGASPRRSAGASGTGVMAGAAMTSRTTETGRAQRLPRISKNSTSMGICVHARRRTSAGQRITGLSERR